MSFNFKCFFRFTVNWLKSMRWAGRRTLIVLVFYVLFPLIEAGVWLGFWLDYLLFRSFRKQAVVKPVFITGMFRSGTTYLHRLMSRDKLQFTTMAMWEVLFAPSIFQRRIVFGLAWLTRGPINLLLNRSEARWQERNVMHKVSLREPEEDEYPLLHIWSALTIGLSAGLLREAFPYTYFDWELSQKNFWRIMGFYQRCVQRHLYAHKAPVNLRYLLINPALCPKLHSSRVFNGCKKLCTLCAMHARIAVVTIIPWKILAWIVTKYWWNLNIFFNALISILVFRSTMVIGWLPFSWKPN